MADPTLTLFDSANKQIAFNDNWTDSADKQAIIDTTAAPKNDHESAILQTLAPGAYTAKVAGANNGSGVGLIEVYDQDTFGSSHLQNIASRGFVDTGDNVLIGGYIVGGYQVQRVVVRGIGPSLTTFGVTGALADPRVELHDAQGTTTATNDNWQDTQKQELINARLAPTNDREAALLTNLQPGNYTAIVSGVSGGIGVGLVEIYNITAP